MNSNAEPNNRSAADNSKPSYELQHLYVKDLSFEAPNTPEIFQREWDPKVNIDLSTKTRELAAGVYELVLMTTVTVTVADKNAYIAEVQQAGIFAVQNFSPDQLGHFLAVHCPTLLFPYVREVISSQILRGGFAPLYLAPVNFEALYAQQQSEAGKN